MKGKIDLNKTLYRDTLPSNQLSQMVGLNWPTKTIIGIYRKTYMPSKLMHCPKNIIWMSAYTHIEPVSELGDGITLLCIWILCTYEYCILYEYLQNVWHIHHTYYTIASTPSVPPLRIGVNAEMWIFLGQCTRRHFIKSGKCKVNAL